MKQSEFTFGLGTTELNYTSHYKYLGVFVDEHLKFKENTNCLANSGSRGLGSLISTYKSNHYMGYQTYTKLFDACIVPILDYWFGILAYIDCSIKSSPGL